MYAITVLHRYLAAPAPPRTFFQKTLDTVSDLSYNCVIISPTRAPTSLREPFSGRIYKGVALGWSVNPSSYPAQIRELFEALMTTGQETIHTFSTKKEAKYFERQIYGYRFALSRSKTHQTGALLAPQFTAEISEDGLTVRLCSVNDTRRARLGAKVLKEQREQFKEKGVEFDYHMVLEEPTPDASQ